MFVKTSVAIGILALCGAVHATSGPNENCTTSCNSSNQQMGNTSSSADNSQSQASQSNPSSNSNSSASNVTISPQVQQSGNTVDQSGNTLHGGNASANGNQSSNSNNSSAANNATNLGGNSSVGNTSSNSGGNVLGNTSNNTNHNTAQGGAGGAGGSVSGSGNSTNRNQNSQDQGQLQGQTQGIDRSGNSTNTLRGGDQAQSMNNSGNSSSSSTSNSNSASRSNSVSGAYSGSNSDQRQSADNHNAIAVDASDRSVTNNKVDARSLFIPQVTQPILPSVNPASNISTIVGSCGPMFRVKVDPITGTYVGLFSSSSVDIGHEDFKIPYVDQNNVQIQYEAFQLPDGSWEVRGHQPIFMTAVLNVSGARNLTIGGGGGSNMNWGQAGAGASGAMQRMVTNIQVSSCIVGKIAADKPQVQESVPVAPMIIESRKISR